MNRLSVSLLIPTQVTFKTSSVISIISSPRGLGPTSARACGSVTTYPRAIYVLRSVRSVDYSAPPASMDVMAILLRLPAAASRVVDHGLASPCIVGLE